VKKIVLVSSFLFAVSIFAVDVDVSTSAEKNIKRDKSITSKSTKDSKDSSRNSTQKSVSRNAEAEITFDPLPIFLRDSRQCIKQSVTISDFGLGFDVGDEDDAIVDNIKKRYVANASESSVSFSKVGGNEIFFKEFLKCVITESAKIAEATLNLENAIGNKNFTLQDAQQKAGELIQKTGSLTNSAIIKLYKDSIEQLAYSCRFLGSQNVVQCGTLTFNFQENRLQNGPVILNAGDKQQGANFFGIGARTKISLSAGTNANSEKSHETSSGKSIDASMSKSVGQTDSQSQKQQTNVAPFFQK
jgi:hypothetical protein